MLPILDTTSFLSSVAVLIAIVACFMIFVVLCRLRVSPPPPSLFRPFVLRASSPVLSTHQPRQYNSNHTNYADHKRPRSWSSGAMFKQAVKQHHQANVPPRKAPIQQQSLDTVILPTTTATRPLANNSGNVAKYHSAAAASRPPPGTARGIKRTSSGLAKVLCDQEDAFEFSNSAASEEDSPTHSYTSVAPKPPANQPAVFFDEDDFDSDNDLDLEDPASIGTIQYPKLPVEQHVGKSVSEKPNVLPPPAFDVDALVPPKRDSGYKSLSSRSSVLQPRPAYTSIKNEPTERTSLPVASARAEVASTKEKKDPPRTSRRKLPWNTEETTQAKDNVDRNASVVSKSKGDKLSRESTARAETTLNSAYLWNTTASAMKEQQKNLRMANKKMTKSNEGTEEEIQQAVTKRRKNNLPRIFLSEEQQHVLNLVIEHKKSVFFTGSAGTGKSVLLREIISSLRKKYHREPDRVAVTASTGLAACNVGGVTLHSFAGIGLGKEHVDDLVKKIRKNQKAKQRWLRTKVLVVDEVSMVDGELFDKLEHIARTLRNNGRPFGGIQLVITGDFFQLPPVPDSGKIAKFAFDAATWNTTIEYTIGLHHIFRQKDPVFANMLNEMREGRLTSASIAAFSKLDRPLPHIEALKDIEATELFPTRQEVDRANSLRMQQLHGQVYHFEARDGGTVLDKAFRAKLLQNCIAPEKVSLKKGAQVMLIKNIDETLVNGSLGRVRGFMNEQMFADYKDNEDAFLNEGEQDAEAKAWQKAEILGLSTQAVYPVVRFALANGTTRDLLCQRESWKVELPNGEVQASREQVPLILAWALSIHKAQGQTLERVRVDLGRVFEKGQAYVALSRATSINGLQVLRFDAKKVIAHEKVRSFYNSLQRAEQAASSKKAKRQRTLAANDYEQNFVTHDDGEEDYNLSAANAMG